jgi:hypothetical protein
VPMRVEPKEASWSNRPSGKLCRQGFVTISTTANVGRSVSCFSNRFVFWGYSFTLNQFLKIFLPYLMLNNY